MQDGGSDENHDANLDEDDETAVQQGSAFLDDLDDQLEELTHGNMYVATLHLINSAIVKLSKLSQGCTQVYRGMNSVALPGAWLSGDGQLKPGVHGGVNFGFSAASPDFKAGLAWAFADKSGSSTDEERGGGLVLAIQQGLVDKGASLGWLSQYPDEDEVTFPPVVCYEVSDARPYARDGRRGRVVVDLRIRVNHAQTIEEELAQLRDVQLVQEEAVETIEHGLQLQQDLTLGRFGGCRGQLVSGKAKFAARTLHHFMLMQEPFAQDDTRTIEREVMAYVEQIQRRALDNPEALLSDLRSTLRDETLDLESALTKVREELEGNMRYVLFEEAREADFGNGRRDPNRQGWRLQKFAELPTARLAELPLSHVAALRFYTTAAFKFINQPLTDGGSDYDQRRPHPLPMTVSYIAEGIKKLRASLAECSCDLRDQRQDGDLPFHNVLWRGMKDLEVTDTFMKMGGTQFAPMSTTSDVSVATRYGLSSGSLLLKINISNQLQHGASLSWLSAFPNEAEVLFPPLSYLQPTGREQILSICGCSFHVVEVEVFLP